jgi:hypothetical protein
MAKNINLITASVTTLSLYMTLLPVCSNLISLLFHEILCLYAVPSMELSVSYYLIASSNSAFKCIIISHPVRSFRYRVTFDFILL